MRICLFSLLPSVLWAQATASLGGRVRDQSGAPLEGAALELRNPLTGFAAAAKSNAEGKFEFSALPLRTYELSVSLENFRPHRQTIAFQTPARQVLVVELAVAAARTVTTITESDAMPLVSPEDTGTRVQLNAQEISRLALSTANRGLEAIVATFPGFAQNANGSIHPRGAHTQMSFVVDGMPITDQLSGAFANAIDPNLVANMEVFTGNIPAEFGAKTAAVINVNTKSGLGSGRAFTGSTALEAGQFQSLGQVSTFAGEKGQLGYSGMLSSRKTQRFLDSVSLDNLHNGGNATRAAFRLDGQAGARDAWRLQFLTGRSDFQLANLRSQHAAGMNARQELADVSTALHWVRTIDAATTWEMNYSWRNATSQLLPSAGDTPVTASQDRSLTTINLSHRYSALRGRHNLRAGFDIQRVPLRERFTFGITESAFNDPEDEDFLPWLESFDLSRGGSLFRFAERATGGLYSGHVQDRISLGDWQVSLGLRWDAYRFLVQENLWQPRLGVSYHLRATNTVFRASYNRLMQTPQNENLLVSSSAQASVLVDPAIREQTGGAVKIRTERQNLLEAGVQQALGHRFSWNTSFYHKNAVNQQDVDNFFNTPILFPLQLAAIRVNSVESRLLMTEWQGWSGSLAVTHGRAISTPPFTGGLYLGNEYVALLNQGPFVIDHDQALTVHGVLNYRHRKGWYATLSARHDSGLVTGEADPREVAQDLDYFDLLPYLNLAGDPPRARPRTIVDVVVGYVHTVKERRRWEVNLQISNVANQTAVFNFQSAFVGTRVVQPRTAGVRWRYYF